MSDLKPIGEEVNLDGDSRHFLFTFNAIHEIQEHFEEKIEDCFAGLTNSERDREYLLYIVYVLLNDEYEREAHKGKTELKKYTLQEVGWVLSVDNEKELLVAVLKAYGLSLPKPDEFENPNVESATQEESMCRA